MANSFGSFARNQAGSGPGIVFNFISQTNQPVNSLIQAAQPGQVVTLWGTGLGPVSGNEAAGPLPGNLPISVEVYVSGQRASVDYAGRSGCCAGIDQIIFTVPQGVTGCYVPVAVRIAGVMSNFTTMAVNPQGPVCSDPLFFSTSDLTTIQNRIQSSGTVNVGVLDIYRIAAKASVTGQGILEGNYDAGEAEFTRYNANVLLNSRGFTGLRGLSSTGSCTVNQFTYRNDYFDNFATLEAIRLLTAAASMPVPR